MEGTHRLIGDESGSFDGEPLVDVSCESVVWRPLSRSLARGERISGIKDIGLCLLLLLVLVEG